MYVSLGDDVGACAGNSNSNSFKHILYWIELFPLQSSGSWAQITLTQSPGSITANLGDTVTMSCKASTGISNDLHWYHQKPGQRPTLIIRYATTLHSGAPDRYSGSYSGTDFTLKISNMKAEDEGTFYCQQGSQLPLTQCYRAVQKPPSSFTSNVNSNINQTFDLNMYLG
uniref:Ig-like domain-containing protein n=2 Tax=Pyxicephalus adspersus TaxID=30357 RepID=A0AAV3AMS7_PYXAD|nr:TPA: hypothetical protein GDO54_009063 [Pyxicephalus adspersus]